MSQTGKVFKSTLCCYTVHVVLMHFYCILLHILSSFFLLTLRDWKWWLFARESNSILCILTLCISFSLKFGLAAICAHTTRCSCPGSWDEKRGGKNADKANDSNRKFFFSQLQTENLSRRRRRENEILEIADSVCQGMHSICSIR